MEQQKTGLLQTIKNKINAFLHDKELKEKLYLMYLYIIPWRYSVDL